MTLHSFETWRLRVYGESELLLMVGSKAASVTLRHNVPYLIVEKPAAGEGRVEKAESRTFRVIGDGEGFDPEGARYVGSVQNGDHTLHVLEVSA